MAYLFQFRELYDELLDSKSRQIVPLLQSWAGANRAVLDSHRKFQRLNVLNHSYEVERDELHSLYALSRVCDTLLLPFQAGECWFDLSGEQFAEFWQTLGIAAREVSEYHPFWCEIVFNAQTAPMTGRRRASKEFFGLL